MVNRLRLPYRAPSIGATHPTPSLAIPPICFIEFDICESILMIMYKRSSNTQEDLPNWGTFFGGGQRRFDQFGTIEGTVSGLEFITDLDYFQVPGGN